MSALISPLTEPITTPAISYNRSIQVDRNPLVTCLCLTRGRPEWLPTAIECFFDQTYRPIELLIVHDYDDSFESEFVLPSRLNWIGGTTVRTVMVRGQQISTSIGAKRNFGCSHAWGSLIAHWDDDDWSGPTRISDQVSALTHAADSGLPVVMCGYRTMLFSDGTPDGYYLYDGMPGFIVGSSLLYQKEWWENHHFPETYLRRGIGEDSRFVDMSEREERVVLDDNQVMYASMHPGNTSPRQANTYSGWRKVERPGWVVDHPALHKGLGKIG